MKRFLKVIFSLIFLCVSGVVLSACGSNTLISVAGVDFYEDEVYAVIGDTVDLKHKVYPSNATNRQVSYWSTDENIVSVSADGVATIKDSGEAYVVVRTIDGGYEDFCKIVTKIDPDEIKWDTTDRRITPVSDRSLPYSGTATVAVDQDVKLEIIYSLAGIENNSAITNKNVKFTSSNPDNIEVINESEGILRAIDNNIRSEEGTPYSDITASVMTAKGELKTTCRVYVNEYSTTGKLVVNKVKGNEPILESRDGSDKLILDADNRTGIECYTLLMNASDYKKDDYSINIYSSNTDVFEILSVEQVDNVYYFTIIPKKEGEERLCIDTTCYDEDGKQISVVINVSVQASVRFVKVGAKDNAKFEDRSEEVITGYNIKWVYANDESIEYENEVIEETEIGEDELPIIKYKDATTGTDITTVVKKVYIPIYTKTNNYKTEIVNDGEIFSLDLTYYDEVVKDGATTSKVIEGAERTLYFEELSSNLVVYKDENGQAYILLNYDNNGTIEQKTVYLKMLNDVNIPREGRVFSDCNRYISKYGNNSFKVINVPKNIDTEFYILGYVAKNNTSEGADGVENFEDRVYFIYTFYVRSELDGVICSVDPATTEEINGQAIETLPSIGTTEVTILLGKEMDLFIYAYSFNLTSPQPARVKIDASSLNGIIEVIQDSENLNKFTLKSLDNTAGEGAIFITVTDGEKTYTTEVVVHVINVTA